MIDLEEIKNQLFAGKDVKEIFKDFNWKKFEETIAQIFRNHEFTVKQNFRFKTKRRHEIDIVALRNGLVICADCKEWSAGRYKASALKKAVEEQESRVAELKRFLKNNFVAQKMLKIKNTFLFMSLLVTLVEEDLAKQNT